MRYRIQRNLEKFVCTGGECEDTCCKGWRIGIDRESYRLYRRVKGRFGRRLFLGIDHKERCFRLKGTACAFLNREGLCDIYKELGREGMCRECRAYPRHVEDYGRLREVMLSMSCPEAARVILDDEARGAWQERSLHRKGKHEQRETVDSLFLQDLEMLRGAMADILKNCDMKMEQRLVMVLALAHDFQRHQNRFYGEGCPCSEQEQGEWLDRLIEKAYLWAGTEKLSRKMQSMDGGETEQMIRMAAWMRLMEEWEPVLPEWKRRLEQLCRCLYHEQSVEEYGRLRRSFEERAVAFERQWGNLALYFVNTYVLGAVYDGDVYGKVKLAVFSVRIIREWCLFRYKVTGRISKEQIVKAASRYSREMENSDRNRDLLERELAENPLFRLDGMMRVHCGR